jgi:hypothetical protein
MKMMPSERIRFGVFLFFFLLAGCAAPKVQPTATPSPTASPAPFITTTLSPAPSPTPTVVGIQWSKDAPVTACLPIQQSLPTGLHLPWILLGEGKGRHVLDPNTGMIDQPGPPNQEGSGYESSPSGKWLAYTVCNDNCSDSKVIVEPASNILTKSTKGRIIWTSPTHSFFLDRWLNKDTLMLFVDDDDAPNILESTLILNPFTGERHAFLGDQYPSVIGSLLPDPTLTRLIFNTRNEKGFLDTVLWDIKNRKTITLLNLRIEEDYSNPPLWSPDGSDFVMWKSNPGRDGEYHAEWFQVTRDGDVHQLTYFSDVFKAVNFDRGRRSADGRYVANRLYYREFDHDKYKYIYFVMDLKTQKLQGFCVDPDVGELGGSQSQPIWSPDNRYVVFSDAEGHDWFLVDVEKQEVYQIADNLEFHPVALIPMEGLLPTSTP